MKRQLSRARSLVVRALSKFRNFLLPSPSRELLDTMPGILLASVSRTSPENQLMPLTANDLRSSLAALKGISNVPPSAFLPPAPHSSLGKALNLNPFDQDWSPLPDYGLVLSQRDSPQFRKVIEFCLARGLPLVFAEVGLFGAIASHKDSSREKSASRVFSWVLDTGGFFYDCLSPSSAIQNLENPGWLPSAQGLDESVRQLEIIKQVGLTKYNYYQKPFNFSVPRSSVLLIDQKLGDASIRKGQSDSSTFRQMVSHALQHFDGKIFVKMHPDSEFSGSAIKATLPRDKKIVRISPSISIVDTLNHFSRISTVTSQVGFEAAIRGANVSVFGAPFYAGWGFTDDQREGFSRGVERSISEVYYSVGIEKTFYVDPENGKNLSFDESLRYIQS